MPNTLVHSDFKTPIYQTPAVGASSGNVAATSTTAALAAPANNTTNYLTGFQVTGAGATAASVILVTVTGLSVGTLTYVMAIPAGANVAVAPLIVNFSPALPASAANTAVTVNVPSFGAGNTNASAVAVGYQQ